ncbi:hypothetical protein [Amycolatopsis sp. VC5-11]|uniref:hypothetical protein n=1 Tax=Amycolatopsis sp. VC5-11 TaxID=3120156 RepID=UPI00300994A6
MSTSYEPDSPTPKRDRMTIAALRRALAESVLNTARRFPGRARTPASRTSDPAPGTDAEPSRLYTARQGRVALTSGRRSGESADIAAHCTVANQFRGFAEQDLHHLARKSSAPSATDSRRNLAQAHADWCRALCDSTTRRALPVGSDDEELGTFARHAAARMGDIILQAERHGGHVSLDFSCEAGARPTETQQPWTLCDADDPVAFVVIPAYTVNGQRLSQQVVYTAAEGCMRSGRGQFGPGGRTSRG